MKRTSLIKSALLALFACAVIVPASADAMADKYYGFETGQITKDPEQKKSANWWVQANDVFTVSTEQNNTEGGERSMKYVGAKKRSKSPALFCSTYESAGAPIKLGPGKYKAECWVYLESGTITDFILQLPAAKFVDGKRVPEFKAKDVEADYESPFRSGRFDTKNVKRGEWCRIETQWALNFNADNYVDSINSFILITYPEGSPAVTFYIDDIKIIKID